MTNLVVRTQVKDILKESGLGLDNLSGDFMDTLDEKVKQLVLDAAKRAKENGRRTIMGKDVQWLCETSLLMNLFVKGSGEGCLVAA